MFALNINVSSIVLNSTSIKNQHVSNDEKQNDFVSESKFVNENFETEATSSKSD